MKMWKNIGIFFFLILSHELTAQEWLDQIDESLSLQSSDGGFRSDLSGLLDLEGYYIDQRPPGLIQSNHSFFNPRLSLFLDTELGPHLYSLVQARFDRGFDPGEEMDGDARADEYLIRYKPWEDARLNLQIGKFATVLGSWVARHDSWNNPFINAPVPYENMTIISDQSGTASPAAFLARKGSPDIKSSWLPMIWGPSYSTGGSLFGTLHGFQYAMEIKNASPSSRPSSWEPNDRLWESPTISGRLGYRPNEAWNVGLSASEGPYLRSAPPGQGIDDYRQFLLGHDVGYASGHWQIWSELFLCRFEVPNVGDADSATYYIEAKYKITPQWFWAVRWNQQFFGEMSDGRGGSQKWDQDMWRAESALGYRFSRHIQAKLQYSHSHQDGPFQQGQNLVAIQMTMKF